MRRAQLWTVGLVIVLGSAGTAAGQTVENPQYKEWAAWREGTSVILKTEQGDEGAGTVTAKQSQTLKQVAADKVVIDVSYIVEAGGATVRTPPESVDIPAKIPNLSDALRDALNAANFIPQGAPHILPNSKETKGRETLTVNGKKLDCGWTQVADEGGSVKVWSCNDVPGRLVKVTLRSGGTTSTTQVLEWTGARK